MRRIKYLILTAAAAFALSGCEAPTNTNTGNANRPATANANAANAAPAAAAPTKESLFALERKGWEAWKNKDRAAIDEVLSARYVGFGPAGRLDKAGVTTMLTNPNCQVTSYSFSDEQMNMVGADVAVLSFKAAQDAVCDGNKLPAEVWASAVYAREGGTWKAVFYAENAVVDPNASPAKPAAPAAATPASTATPAASSPNALTTELMATETKAWEAWKNRDAKAMDEVLAKGFINVSGSGRRDRAASLKGWTEPKCEGIAYTLTEPASISLSPDAALVTYKADQKGTCDGKPLPQRLWGASVNVKEGDAWKNAFFTEAMR